MRIGMGYDVHRLVEGRKLIMGGVEIPYDQGLLGHSDADVLLHAIMDALLGAAALGDIGKHFPDTDPAYKGISSIELLKRVGELLVENRFLIENIDATIIAQAPKMRPYIDRMRENIATALEIETGQVNVKADRRRAWFYRYGRRHLRSGDLYADQSQRTVQRGRQREEMWRVQRMSEAVCAVIFSADRLGLTKSVFLHILIAETYQM